jgi:MinD-like ATPase involved in chromosome partitioning or flagellar assembly
MDAVQRLVSGGVAVVAICPAGDQRSRERLERIGVTACVADDAGPAALVAAARTAAAGLGTDETGRRSTQRAVADPRSAFQDGEPGQAVLGPSAFPLPENPPPAGRVVAVWGPAGSPGRSMLAGNLAAEAAEAGVPTLLVDADVYGGVQSSAFGLLDESPGLAGACRLAANGRLDLTELTRLVWAVGPALRLLTGIARADRWPEIRPSSLPAVLAVCRSMARLTIVDCGFCLEADEEITFDTVAPRRNGATLAVLADADEVVVVGSADPPGMERLVRGLAELGEMVPEAVPTVVLNRSRRSAASADESAAALGRFAGLPVRASLPEDRAATDRAWQLGLPLLQAAPGSALRKGLRQLAAALAATGVPARKLEPSGAKAAGQPAGD